MGDFPVALGKYLFAITADASLTQTQNGELRVLFPQIEITETEAFDVNPRLLLSGYADKMGLYLENVSFTDTLSFLNGSGAVSLNRDDNTDILNSASIVLQMENSLSDEKYDVNFTADNPEKKIFSLLTFRDDYYFSGAALVHALPARYFIANQNPENTISGNFYLSGTLNDPVITAEVTNASLALGAIPVAAHGMAAFSKHVLQVFGVTVSAGPNTISDLSLDFSFKTLTGSASAEYSLNLGTDSASAPIALTVLSEETNYTISLTSPGFSGTLFDKPKPFEMNIVRTDGRFDVFTVNTGTVSGWRLDSGVVSLNVGGDSPVRFEIDGIILPDSLNLNVRNLAIDVSAFSKLLAFPAISVYAANLTGDVHVGGTPQSPEFSGSLNGTAIDLNVPDYVQEHLLANNAAFTIYTDELSHLVSDTVQFRSNSANALLDLELIMDGWRFEQLTLAIKTLPNSFQASHVVLERMEINGFGECDLNIELVPESVTVTGSIHVQNGSLEIDTVPPLFTQTIPVIANPQAVIVDLSITAGNRVQAIVNSPVINLRGLITPGTVLTVRSDSAADIVDLRGDILLRSGQIEYFNRTFYVLSNAMSPSRIVFDGNADTIDPLLTVRAEIRESDDTGEQVRITMQATNQRFSDFTASFTASPPRSEAEIMSLLGQIFIGNNENVAQILIGGGTSFVQNIILHTIEDGLRDLLKFDIFSIRTMAFQNILENRLNLADLRDNKLTAGNIFNNSTVYIGKYFGSSIYFDALVHFLYNEAKEQLDPESNGIIFQPEIGLEMSVPFANSRQLAIRMSLAPELGGDELSVTSAFVSAASITLSWKFNF
jgi:hypothetical protein